MQELAEYDAVVNCMGLRGATLFGDDSCYPIRGQVLRARAPWIKHHYVVDERFYVIPNNDLGGSPCAALLKSLCPSSDIVYPPGKPTLLRSSGLKSE